MAKAPRCPMCDYDLSGLGREDVTGECPECGCRISVGTEILAIKARLQGGGARKCAVCGRQVSAEDSERCPGCGSRYAARP